MVLLKSLLLEQSAGGLVCPAQLPDQGLGVMSNEAWRGRPDQAKVGHQADTKRCRAAADQGQGLKAGQVATEPTVETGRSEDRGNPCRNGS